MENKIQGVWRLFPQLVTSCHRTFWHHLFPATSFSFFVYREDLLDVLLFSVKSAPRTSFQQPPQPHHSQELCGQPAWEQGYLASKAAWRPWSPHISALEDSKWRWPLEVVFQKFLDPHSRRTHSLGPSCTWKSFLMFDWKRWQAGGEWCLLTKLQDVRMMKWETPRGGGNSSNQSLIWSPSTCCHYFGQKLQMSWNLSRC